MRTDENTNCFFHASNPVFLYQRCATRVIGCKRCCIRPPKRGPNKANARLPNNARRVVTILSPTMFRPGDSRGFPFSPKSFISLPEPPSPFLPTVYKTAALPAELRWRVIWNQSLAKDLGPSCPGTVTGIVTVLVLSRINRSTSFMISISPPALG